MNIPLQIRIGNEVQVYPKGDAPDGCLVTFGKVQAVDELQDGTECVKVKGEYYSVTEYDVVVVSLANPMFAKIYGYSAGRN